MAASALSLARVREGSAALEPSQSGSSRPERRRQHCRCLHHHLGSSGSCKAHPWAKTRGKPHFSPFRFAQPGAWWEQDSPAVGSPSTPNVHPHVLLWLPRGCTSSPSLPSSQLRPPGTPRDDVGSSAPAQPVFGRDGQCPSQNRARPAPGALSATASPGLGDLG